MCDNPTCTRSGHLVVSVAHAVCDTCCIPCYRLPGRYRFPLDEGQRIAGVIRCWAHARGVAPSTLRHANFVKQGTNPTLGVLVNFVARYDYDLNDLITYSYQMQVGGVDRW